MKIEEVVIATMTLAKTESEETELKEALNALAQLNIPVVTADGGSRESFISFLKSVPQFTVIRSKEGGLLGQIKASLSKAQETNAPFVLYTEPDKKIFFETKLLSFVNAASTSANAGLVLAGRSEQGFASFPPFQQMTETTVNNCCAEVIGREADYGYGPFLMHRRLIPYISAVSEDIGWGWRPFIFGMAARLGLSVEVIIDDFMCPQHQQSEDRKDRLYRMQQLEQSIWGLILSTTTPYINGQF